MGRHKKNERAGDGIGETFVPIVSSVLESAAWASLPCVARALFIELRRRVDCQQPWVNNGKVFLSTRQAARILGVAERTAREAFYELQRRGFIVVGQLGRLGAEGQGKATTYRLTDCASQAHPRGTQEYKLWKRGHDFEVVKAPPPRSRPRRRSEPRAFAGVVE